METQGYTIHPDSLEAFADQVIEEKLAAGRVTARSSDQSDTDRAVDLYMNVARNSVYSYMLEAKKGAPHDLIINGMNVWFERFTNRFKSDPQIPQDRYVELEETAKKAIKVLPGYL